MTLFMRFLFFEILCHASHWIPTRRRICANEMAANDPLRIDASAPLGPALGRERGPTTKFQGVTNSRSCLAFDNAGTVTTRLESSFVRNGDHANEQSPLPE